MVSQILTPWSTLEVAHVKKCHTSYRPFLKLFLLENYLTPMLTDIDTKFYYSITLSVLNFACTKFRKSQKILISRVLIFARLGFFSISRVLNFANEGNLHLLWKTWVGSLKENCYFSIIFLKQNGYNNLCGVFFLYLLAISPNLPSYTSNTIVKF